MEKIDYKKELKHLYAPSANTVVQIEIPAMNFLMIDGQGDPGTSQEYADAVEALFSVSYAVKFAVKKSDLSIDYGVLPLEGLWWADDMSVFETNDKSAWKWTMMIMQPDFIKVNLINEAIEAVQKKKKLSALNKLRLETFKEGSCAQTLHIGPFSEEGPIIKKVHDYINKIGKLTGKHHEIYLTDIRKAAPSNWKTIIRQPYIINQ